MLAENSDGKKNKKIKIIGMQNPPSGVGFADEGTSFSSSCKAKTCCQVQVFGTFIQIWEQGETVVLF